MITKKNDTTKFLSFCLMVITMHQVHIDVNNGMSLGLVTKADGPGKQSIPETAFLPPTWGKGEMLINLLSGLTNQLVSAFKPVGLINTALKHEVL